MADPESHVLVWLYGSSYYMYKKLELIIVEHIIVHGIIHTQSSKLFLCTITYIQT